MTKKWSNWGVFFVGVILAFIIALFVKNYYFVFFPSSGWLASEIGDTLESFFNSFLFLYTFFITFFYKAFSKNFKPIGLVYFLALPFLLFISSLSHITSFLVLFAVGWLLGHLASKAFFWNKV